MTKTLFLFCFLFGLDVARAEEAAPSPASQQTRPREVVEIQTPSFSIRFNEDGRPVSLRASEKGERIFPRRESSGFTLTWQDEQRKTHTRRMTSLTRDGDLLVAEEEGFRIQARVIPGQKYLVMRLVGVEEPAGKTLLRLHFEIKVEGRARMQRLDHMTAVSEHGAERTAHWNWLWGRNEHNPLGAFAFYLPEDDTEDDEILLQLWVHESLPRPKVEGEWTADRARTWLADWQARFVDQSTMIIQPQNEEELYQLSETAHALGMKKIYLHTDTWRGEYWPAQNSFLHVRRDIFPGGETSLRSYSEFLQAKGLSIALHTVSGAIARHDPDYVSGKIDERLATWIEGSLAEPLDETSGIFYFKPPAGAVYPEEIAHVTATPNTMPKWINIRCFRIGDELVEARHHEVRDDGIWVFSQCSRSHYETPRRSHPTGARVRGLCRPYGQSFTAGVDSTLLAEIASRYAGFCNRNNIDHLECDGLEAHSSRPWGPGKFSWLLYERTDHPCTSNTSSGRPLPFHIEYWFKSSQDVVRNHPSGGVAGGDGVPLYLHHSGRPATGPYEIHLKPTWRGGRGGQTVNFMRPIPMFGISTEVLRSHGLRDLIANSILSWKQALPRLSQAQKDGISAHFTRYRSPIGEARNQTASDILLRPVTAAGQLKLEPFRVMHPPGGGMNWGWGQEYGPLVPKTYLQVGGDAVTLENPFAAQEPEFLLRLLPSFEAADQPLARGRAQSDAQVSTDSLVEQYNLGAGQGGANHPLSHAKQIGVPENFENGKPKQQKVRFYLRKTFSVEKLADVGLASLFYHTDQHSEIHFNGQKIYIGGNPGRTLMLDLTNRLTGGRNTLAIGVNNGPSPSAFSAAILIRVGEEQTWIGTGRSWIYTLNRDHRWARNDLDTTGWKPVLETGEYGESPIGRGAVLPVKMDRSLMPRSVNHIRGHHGHQVSLENGNLTVKAENRTGRAAIATEERPWWPASSNMHQARGLGMTITGDGSGAVLVVSLDEGGRRDYVVPIDFTGTRDVVIANGEVAWSDPNWGWRSRTAHFKYESIYGVQMGFGIIPHHAAPAVTIRKLRLIEEKKVALDNLEVAIGKGSCRIEGRVETDQYLWYRGSETVEVFDLNWQKLGELPVSLENFEVATGAHLVSLRGEGARPFVEAQFVVVGPTLTW